MKYITVCRRNLFSKLPAMIFISVSLASTSALSSEVEDLILLCKGGMDISQIIKVSGEIEGRLKRLIKSDVDVEGSYEERGTISQYDIIKLVKEGVSEDLYRFDISSYHNCVESMGPRVLSTRATVAGESIRIDRSGYPELVKIPIKTHLKDDTRIIFQYAKEEGENYVVAFRLVNKEGSRDQTFQLKPDTVRLIGEDSAESFGLLGMEGLAGERSPKIIVPPKSSGLAKFIFDVPSTNEPITLSSYWPWAGSTSNLGMAITFHLNPLRIVWVDVESRDYKFSGEPTTQAF